MLFHTHLHSESVKDTNKILILLCSKLLSHHRSTTNWNLIIGLVPSRFLGSIELLTTPMQCRILFIFTFPHNPRSTLSPPFYHFLTTLEEIPTPYNCKAKCHPNTSSTILCPHFLSQILHFQQKVSCKFLYKYLLPQGYPRQVSCVLQFPLNLQPNGHSTRLDFFLLHAQVLKVRSPHDVIPSWHQSLKLLLE